MRNLKKIICLMLLISIFNFPVDAAESTEIPDGEYGVNATFLLASSDEVSRMNNALVNPLNIVVDKGKINVYLTIARPTKEMKDLKISLDGGKNYNAAQLSSESESSTKYKFQVNNLDEIVSASIYVDVMGSNPLFRIAFKKSDVEDIKKKTAEKIEKQKVPEKEEVKAVVKQAPLQKEKKVEEKKDISKDKVEDKDKDRVDDKAKEKLEDRESDIQKKEITENEAADLESVTDENKADEGAVDRDTDTTDAVTEIEPETEMEKPMTNNTFPMAAVIIIVGVGIAGGAFFLKQKK